RGEASRRPLGRGEPDPRLVEEARGAPRSARDLEPRVDLRPERVEALERLDGAVDDGLALHLEGAEDAVPDDESAAVVLVDVARVDPVMAAVVRRRVEDPLDGAEL